MTIRIRVRPATPEDVPQLMAFNLAMAQESEARGLDPERLRGGITHLLTNPRDGFFLCAEADDAVAGSLMVTYEWSDWRNGRFWWIQSVYVQPAHRRQGLYRALHTRVQELARADPEACGVRLYVERDNHNAMATYRALGMVETHYRLYEEEF